MKYLCPVCGFGQLDESPTDFNICPCCGTEFDYDDASLDNEQLRHRWIAGGGLWYAVNEWPPPPNWNAFVQLAHAGLVARIGGMDTGTQMLVHRVQGRTLGSNQIGRVVLTLTSTTETLRKAA